jgi:hypothetical protein
MESFFELNKLNELSDFGELSELSDFGELNTIDGFYWHADYDRISEKMKNSVDRVVRSLIMKHDLASCHFFTIPYSLRFSVKTGWLSKKHIILDLDKVVLKQTRAILSEKNINRTFCFFQGQCVKTLNGLTNGWTVAFLQNSETTNS